jgi:hypothetical protein
MPPLANARPALRRRFDEAEALAGRHRRLIGQRQLGAAQNPGRRAGACEGTNRRNTNGSGPTEGGYRLRSIRHSPTTEDALRYPSTNSRANTEAPAVATA